MKQPELSLEFRRWDTLYDGFQKFTVMSVDYSKGELVVKQSSGGVHRVEMWKALRWYSERDGECIRNPWSKP